MERRRLDALTQAAARARSAAGALLTATERFGDAAQPSEQSTATAEAEGRVVAADAALALGLPGAPPTVVRLLVECMVHSSDFCRFCPLSPPPPCLRLSYTFFSLPLRAFLLDVAMGKRARQFSMPLSVNAPPPPSHRFSFRATSWRTRLCGLRSRTACENSKAPCNERLPQGTTAAPPSPPPRPPLLLPRALGSTRMARAGRWRRVPAKVPPWPTLRGRRPRLQTAASRARKASGTRPRRAPLLFRRSLLRPRAAARRPFSGKRAKHSGKRKKRKRPRKSHGWRHATHTSSATQSPFARTTRQQQPIKRSANAPPPRLAPSPPPPPTPFACPRRLTTPQNRPRRCLSRRRQRRQRRPQCPRRKGFPLRRKRFTKTAGRKRLTSPTFERDL